MKNAFLRAAGALAVIAVFLCAVPAAGQVTLTAIGTPYTQNFDTLANTGTTNTWTDNSTILGWYAVQTIGTLTVYRADNGGSNAGALYSYGTTATTERALGSAASGTPGNFFYGVRLVNNTGVSFDTLLVSYTGEQWRNGGNATAQTLAFSYQVANAGVITAINTPTTGWTAVPALDFVTPIHTATAAALDGNAAANRTALSTTITFASPVANGQEVWIRWNDLNDAGNDHGVSVDDLSVTPQIALPTLTINDISLSEGNAGTTTFTFTATLSALSATDVTFDVATADGTINPANAGTDYVAIPTTQYKILANNLTTTIDVTVNGDLTIEPNETFFVNLSNPSGAVITDNQGLGTILNDDSPPNLSINDVTHNEGNAGTTTYSFTVTLDAPAQAGGVTFDIATADNTALLSDSDYVANTLTSQTIPQGSTTYNFDVTVNGDLNVEPDETFFVNVTNVTGATVADAQGLGTITNDDQAVTLIHDIQGAGAASPMVAAAVTIDGIVVGSFQGASGLGGFYVEEEDADQDADPATSEGIFVFSNATPVAVGDHVHVSGTVVEFNNMTELSPVTSVTVLGSGSPLPTVAHVTLPASPDPLTAWERYEGMLVDFPQSLIVSDTFNMGKFGEIGLSSGGRLLQPTNAIDPNDSPASGTTYVGPWTNTAAVTAAQAANTNNLITIDDGHGSTNFSPEVYNPAGGNARLGNSVSGLTGVMTYQFNLYMVEPTAPVIFTATNPRTGPPAVGSPTVKVSFHNTLNFFVNTQDIQPPSIKRGAANAAEFTRQRDKLVAALSGIGADVIGLSELEKDPTAITPALPQNAAAQSLAAGMTTATGHTWAAIVDPWTCETDNTAGCDIGTDPDIKCGIIYDTTKVTPTTATAFTDLVAAAGTYSRGPYAQVFTINATGGKFGLVVNHLKAKSCSGGTGLDADQLDGQACYNNRRMLQAVATSNFVATNPGFTGVPNVLVMGDMNAYGEEDPIDAFRANGMVDLIGADTSYNFGGQSGHIDHALCTAAMQPFVTGAGVWHINADEPVVTDYVLPATSPGKPTDAPYAPDAYRSSDHDPVLVGIMGTVPVSLTSFSAE